MCLRAGRTEPDRPRRGRLLLRPRARRGRRRRDLDRATAWEGLRHAVRRARAALPATALPGLDPAQRPLRRRTTSRTPPPRTSRPACDRRPRAGARRPRRARLATSPGRYADGALEVLATQALPHSLGLLYEELTAHLGFRRSSDEYKVMAMASYGRPRVPRRAARARPRRPATAASATDAVDCRTFAPRAALRRATWTPAHADLAASVQRALEEVLLELGALAARAAPGERRARAGRRRRAQLRRQLAAAGARGRSSGSGCSPPPATPAPRSAPRCTSRRELGRPRRADGDGGARPRAGPTTSSRPGCDAAPGAVRAARRHRRRRRRRARRRRHRRLVPGPQRVRPARARAPLAARRPAAAPRTSSGSTTSRAASSSGRSRRWCWPSGRAEIFDGGPLPSPYMLFVHDVAPRVAGADPGRRARRRHRARADRRPRPRSRWSRAMLDAFEARTGRARRRQHRPRTPPGRPMVDDPRDALECFGSAPVDALAIGPFLRRAAPRRRMRPRRLGRRDRRRRHPDAPGARRSRAARGARRRDRPRRRDRGRRPTVRDRRLRRRPAPRRARRRPRAGRGPQRRLAAATRRGSPSSTTTCCPPPGWRARARAPTSRPPARRGRRARAGSRVPLPATAPDRLGAQRRRPRDAPLGHRRHGVPARRRWRPSAASTSASRAPTARTPTSALRVVGAGWRIVRGRAPRRAPRRRGRRRGSRVRKQAGNADDVLMRRLHGRGWRERAGAPRGRRRRHLAIAALAPRARRAPRLPAAAARRGAGAAAAGRRAPPSSPWAADRARAAHAARGRARWLADERGRIAGRAPPPARLACRGALATRRAAARGRAAAPPAVLLRPRRHAGRSTSPTTAIRSSSSPMPGAARGARPAARAGVRLARRRPTRAGSRAGSSAPRAGRRRSTRRVEALLGPLGPLAVCPHGPDDGCGCRKPAPGAGPARAARRSASTRARARDRRHRRRRRGGPRGGRPRRARARPPATRRRGGRRRRPSVAADLGRGRRPAAGGAA